MKTIKVRAAMHRKSEPADFHLFRDNGQAAYNFVHFFNPVVIVTDQQEIVTENNACILYTPCVKQEYYALPEGFVNDFLTFTAEDSQWVPQFGLPENKVFYVRDGGFITEAIEYISWAFVDFMEDHTTDLPERVYSLLRELSEQQILDSPRSQRMFQTWRRFFNLRETVRSAPQEWTVERMAKAVYLTRSRFYVLYRSLFNITPSADLIEMTLDYAKRHLLETEEPISRIAQISGYSSVEHFIRLFHQREGVTPGQFRKNHARS